MGDCYNGYSWKQRNDILIERKKLERKGTFERLSYLLEKRPCAMCADPEPGPGWHSEDYSHPHIFSPPATYAICSECHSRLHKRFHESTDWPLFVEHLKAGGYGSEFVRHYSAKQRASLLQELEREGAVSLSSKHPRAIDPHEWWLHLSLDPESKFAPWARPRPLQPRPNISDYKAALEKIDLSEKELSLLREHARSQHRTASMRQLATSVFATDKPHVANLHYGALSRKLAEVLGWQCKGENVRDDGSPIWMSTVAEGWQPPQREYEWTMVPSLHALFA